MKKIILISLLIVLSISCKRTSSVETENTNETIAAFTPEMEENAVIYEVNIRQYSNEGSFDAFTKDIPELKKLGVKIIWVMPIFPISQTKRKATGGDDSKFASEMPEAEQSKYLGSYYAVTDFTKVNPEFGSIENFRNLVKTAHDNGIYVILDWVPNHTGWDHVWLKEHPEFYTKNKKGEVISPAGTDWTDVADLDYSNKELRAEMTSDMMYWIKDENIDGFRCDMASKVPTDFWEETIPKLRKQKNIFMLAEAWEPELMKSNLFDMCYSWDGHHTINKIVKGENNVSDWDKLMLDIFKKYESDDILMNFVDNHDENSWNGTMKSRLGNAEETMTALSYVVPGMPLIYSGDEYGLDYSLKFFEKDSIPKTKGKQWEWRAKLGKLKNENPALNGGKNPASYTRIKSSNDTNILAIERAKNNKNIIYLANLSKTPQQVTANIEGDFIDYMSGNKIKFTKDQKINLKPWQYYILVKE